MPKSVSSPGVPRMTDGGVASVAGSGGIWTTSSQLVSSSRLGRGVLDVDGVMARAAGDDVGAVVGDADDVVAAAAEDRVLAGAADHGVGAVAARDAVVVGAAVEGVGAV